MLKKADISFTEPVPGKLVVVPPPGPAVRLTVTFWPARERLRLGSRPTKRGQGLRAFELAVLDQGHHIPGHPDGIPKSRVFLELERAQAERVRRWLEQQAHLEEAKSAIDECMALSLQRLRDLAAGHRIGGNNAPLRAAKRRFRSARRRAMRMSDKS